MTKPTKKTTFCLAVIALWFLAGDSAWVGADDDNLISFNRDIRPILSDKCFQCHGPDEESREAELRFDIKAEAMAVIEPGSRDDSELIQRIVEEDPDSRMPPLETNKPLTAREIELLKKWIANGAPWSQFWAYVPPKKTDPPKLKSKRKYDNWIDQFVTARLEQHALVLSPPADRITLLRRIYFDLIGLPPTPDQVDAFLADRSPQAVEKVVDQLLASEHFGERLSIYWLDLVRYADTVGYHGDQPHNISPYRDWVIKAFNDNLPFDQFTREQIAGDLLANPTESQKIASGYNRLLQTTHEGGLQPKEYSAIYAADRVRNFSVVWMGATMGCAQCHDHKYDPYTSKDFYSLSAFFADVDDEQHFKAGTNTTPTKRPPEILIIADEHRHDLALAEEAVQGQKQLIAERKQLIAELQKAEKQMGKEAKEKANQAAEKDEPEVEQKSQKSKVEPPTEQQDETVTDEQVEKSAEQRAALTEERKIEEKKNLIKDLSAQEQKLKTLVKAQRAVESRGAWTMISQPLSTPRVTRVLARGNWMDESGPVVAPAIPGFLGEIKTDSPRLTRLDLANWMTDESSDSGKLTARVFANRIWYLMIGVGISKSLDDFGGQGEPPAFPELLDNLAIEFVENGWDVKQLIRLIVTSKTYQQDSFENDYIRKADPYNQFFSHQSRYRLPAELIRDTALAISGLLNVDQIGGKSIKPVQPPGYYQHLNFPTRKYVAHDDQRQWRRGVYIHWQRMFLHPSLKAFDAPSREECTAQRAKSNTPSAALALLNDPIFVEAARVFAARIISETDSDRFESRLETAFRLAVSRQPESGEQKILKTLYDQSLREFVDDPASTTNLLAIGQAPQVADIDGAKLAAWTTVARAILNLNETITRN